MIQRGFDLYFVPHVPMPGAPPGVAQVPNHGRIIFFASSKARMAVHSVTGEGSALATCLAFFFGLNMNCGDPWYLPTGMSCASTASRRVQRLVTIWGPQLAHSSMPASGGS